jgi:hypothetical protein
MALLSRGRLLYRVASPGSGEPCYELTMLGHEAVLHVKNNAMGATVAPNTRNLQPSTRQQKRTLEVLRSWKDRIRFLTARVLQCLDRR